MRPPSTCFERPLRLLSLLLLLLLLLLLPTSPFVSPLPTTLALRHPVAAASPGARLLLLSPLSPPSPPTALLSEKASPPSTSAFVSSTALITGTAIGAGVISLPLLSLPLGFIPSSLLLFTSYLVMLCSALVVAENQINLTSAAAGKRTPGTPAPKPLSLLVQVSLSLGPLVSKFATATYLFVHYAVVTSYMASGGEYVALFVSKLVPSPEFFSLPPSLSPMVYGAATFAPMLLLPEKTMAAINNLLVLAALASFLAIISFGLPTVDTAILQLPETLPPLSTVAPPIPVFLLTLVFHNVIPTVSRLLDYDPKAIRSAISLGSVVPFLLFLLYNFTILGNVGVVADLGAAARVVARPDSDPAVSRPATTLCCPLSLKGSVCWPSRPASWGSSRG